LAKKEAADEARKRVLAKANEAEAGGKPTRKGLTISVGGSDGGVRFAPGTGGTPSPKARPLSVDSSEDGSKPQW
jgi:hypothetical protein